MERKKRHEVKNTLSASTSSNRDQEEFDLTHYTDDRVELMHQVFSVLKTKEIKAMVPQSLRHVPMDNLKELLTEEVLGISTKRLLAILNGTEPPSETESSSPSPSVQLETLSLDNMSSEDIIVTQHSRKKKKHKHRRRHKQAKQKSKTEDEDNLKASGPGHTVLEILELEARARAIRAHLQQEQGLDTSARVTQSHESSENEVEIKDEQLEVVEISSDEEKPKIVDLQEEKQQSIEFRQQTSTKTAKSETESMPRRDNDLIITVPQAKVTKKIKVNRNRTAVSADLSEKSKSPPDQQTIENMSISVENQNVVDKLKSATVELEKINKKKKTSKIKEINNYEITLQLSDSVEMDVLQSLEPKFSITEDSNGSSGDHSASGENVKSI